MVQIMIHEFKKQIKYTHCFSHISFWDRNEIDYIFPCGCTVIDHKMTSQRIKNKKYDMRRSRVAWLLFFTRYDIIYHSTHAWKNVIYFFFTNKFKWFIKELAGRLGHVKNKNKSADVIWRGFDVIYRQQPMKMYIEAMLLYNNNNNNHYPSSWNISFSFVAFIRFV